MLLYGKENAGRKGPSRSVCLRMGLALLLLVNLWGCIWYRPLRIPQLREFERAVHQKYPRTGVWCEYEYGAGVSITVERRDIDEECAYTVLGYLYPIVTEEAFIQELFTLFERESHGDPNWKNGARPDIWLFLEVDGKYRYQFCAGANQETYNSGRSPDSYTWDGYATWYGIENGEGWSREISAQEVREGIERYS